MFKVEIFLNLKIKNDDANFSIVRALLLRKCVVYFVLYFIITYNIIL